MSAQAGNLHIVRQRVALTADATPTNIDTGIAVASQAYDKTGSPSDPVDPPLGIHQASAPAAGATPASRLQVIPLPPMAAWTGVTIGEPYFDTDTNTVHVELTSNVEGGSTVNVLFWAPHTCCGPIKVAAYNPAEIG